MVADSVGLHLRRAVTPLPIVELQGAAHLKLGLERACGEVCKDAHLHPPPSLCALGSWQRATLKHKGTVGSSLSPPS